MGSGAAGVCDVTNNSRHLGFYQEWEISLNREKWWFFCAREEKYNINKHFAWFKPQDLLLLSKKVEKAVLSLKNGLNAS